VSFLATVLGMALLFTLLLSAVAWFEGGRSLSEIAQIFPEVLGTLAGMNLLAMAIIVPVVGIGAAIVIPLSRKWRWAETFFTGALIGFLPFGLGYEWISKQQLPWWPFILAAIGCGVIWATVDRWRAQRAARNIRA
jgi:hypothetical protein